MATIYITAASEKAGKTMLCAGLGKSWMDSGKKVGYLKPVIAKDPGQTAGADKDALFIQKLWGLAEAAEALNPVLNSQADQVPAFKQALAAVSQGKDIVIVEGLPLKDSGSLIEALDASVLVVHDYASPVAASLEEYQKLGGRLLGVVLNKIPGHKLERLKGPLVEQMAQAGLNLVGIIPEDRILMTLSVADLAGALQGKILNNADKGNELIENFMLGSSTFDRGPAYYNRKNNKAVLLWGERPGFRKAAIAGLVTMALQTSTKCVVISHSGAPLPAIAQKAEAQQIPLISAPGTLPDLISALENSMGQLKFNQEKKLPKLLEIMDKNFNLRLISRQLGLAA